MTKKKFAYIRVSSQEQKEDRQIDTMKSLGIDERDIFIDKLSGKDLERPQYQALKTVARDGDTIVFDSITRLSRNMSDIKKEYEYFVSEKISLEFVKEPVLNTQADTDDIMKKAINDIILTLLAAFAQKEREDIKQRQKEGIAAARARGKHLGRPSLKLNEDQQKIWKDLYPKWKAKEITAVAFMKELDIKSTSFYKLVKDFDKKK
ncbi:recombinase family protein [Viridibacillus arvi]|uniref:recombinase family protein n=1 Tax=Viridibacillus arvi TaxID=263475 RepID=UPI0034CDD2CC